eukprot:Nitzschia sp. Nitz4//scaffold97_size77645//58136//59633//NITZ4_005526-RA/size77645-augustus-gene-0.71-mRNA-1//1//CDS//3329560680//3186//frame0
MRCFMFSLAILLVGVCQLSPGHAFHVHFLLQGVSPPTTSNPPFVLSASSSSDSSDKNLPDFGSTPVEVDTIKLKKVAPSSTKQNPWRRHDLSGSSMVPQTLKDLETDEEFQNTLQRRKSIGVEGMTREEKIQRRRALGNLGIPSFAKFLSEKSQSEETSNPPAAKTSLLQRKPTKVLQLNVGLYCNQACAHCHVESSPLRTEMMTTETAARCLELLRESPSITTLDITGGAPELNSSFRYLVQMARNMRPSLQIIDRCNLSVLQEPHQEDLVEFLKSNKVHVIASLPCYSAENVNTQRGGGVFDRSIAGLLALNEAGYGKDPDLPLDLVYNPLGAFLPPPQDKLEKQYKDRLNQDFGIVFNNLFTMTNMPIKRFADFLVRRGELQDYMSLLVRNYNGDTVENLMCRDTISVGWDGKIYDCDFNQQLSMGLRTKAGGRTVHDIASLDELINVPVLTDNHCFGCTAGMGSS